MSAADAGFRATAFHAEDRRQAGGRVVLGASSLRFEGGADTFDWPFAGLILGRGGLNDSTLFLTHPRFPAWTLSVSDPGILDHPSIRAVAASYRQSALLERRPKGSRRVWFAMAAGGVLIVALLVWVALQKDRWVNAITARIPITLDIELGKRSMESLKPSAGIIPDAALRRQLDAVTRRLLAGVDQKEFPYEFHISSDTNLNAFALPGGQVVVNAGLIRAAKRPEELAGVLAHELAHVTRRHGIRKLVESAGLMLTVQALFGDVSGIEAVLVKGSQQLLQQKYSRDFEREADDTGWDYMLGAEIDPRGMIEFFRTLLQEQERAGAAPGGALSLLSTHPATEDRIRALESRWSRADKSRTFRPILSMQPAE